MMMNMFEALDSEITAFAQAEKLESPNALRIGYLAGLRRAMVLLTMYGRA
jgi:hypothetical protein